MSEKLIHANMTEEAKNYRQKFDGQTNNELLSGVNDLVGDRFQVTKNNRLQNKAGIMAKDAAGNVRNIGGRFEHQSQLEDVAAYEDQIRLGMKAKEIVPALKLIDAALAVAWRRSTRAKTPGKVDEVAIIRKHLVISKAMTALEVGNMSDEDVTTLIGYARTAKAQAEAPRVKKSLPSPESFGEDTEYFQPSLPGIEEFGEDETAFQAVLPGFETFGEDDAEPADELSGAEEPMGDASDRKRVPSFETFGEDENTEATSPTPELEQKLADLETARAKWASISTKRQGRTFDRRIKGYNAAKDEYFLLVQELGRIQCHTEIEAAETTSQKNAISIAYQADEQNKLRDLIRHETDARFINKFSNWMNKGSRKARIAKGVLIGAAAGAVGSVFLAGAAGAVGAAGVVIGASRFARGYTMRNKAGIDQLNDRQIATAQSRANMQTNNSDQFAYTSEIFRDYFEADSKREQAKRRKAVYWGVGSVALGAVAGHLVHVGIDSLSGHDGAVPVKGGAPLHDHSGHGGGAVSGPEHPPISGPGHDLLNAPGVYNVHPGEGWYETFKDMGLPADKWADVLKDAGPKLHEQGLAYFDNAHHEWRISHAGHLPNAAVQTLKDASARHGFSFR